MTANTSARSMAPTPVNTQASSELDPEVTMTAASVAGRRNTPDPIMLPATRAVDIQFPSSRLSSGRSGDRSGAGRRASRVTIGPPFGARSRTLTGTRSAKDSPSTTPMLESAHLSLDPVFLEVLREEDVPGIHDDTDAPPHQKEHRPEEAMRAGERPDRDQEGVDHDVDEQMPDEVPSFLQVLQGPLSKQLRLRALIDRHRWVPPAR